LKTLNATLRKALEATSTLFAPIVIAFGWVHQAAHIFGQVECAGAVVRKQRSGLLGGMRCHRKRAGSLSSTVDHFVKVSRSDWPGLFACYDTPDLPRTNNDLEQAFGQHRYHERRAMGRKGASPALVLRGSVRLTASLASRLKEHTAANLAMADRAEWQSVRAELEVRRMRRVERRRFRRDPKGYLEALENKLIQSRLLAQFF